MVAACHDQECEATRLDMARIWETLRNTATSRKQIPEATDLTKAQAEARILTWTQIEERAEFIRSSFQTAQVTWSAAEKARGELGEIFKSLESNDDPMTRGFGITLDEADKRYAEFKQACR